MESKQVSIDGKLYGVTTLEAFSKNQELYNNYYTAVEMHIAGEHLVLPVRSPLDNKPGLYNHYPIYDIIRPKEDDKQYQYSSVIDMSDATIIDDLLEKQDQVRDIERDILTSPDDITVPNISNLDTPEMRGLKEAIKEKKIDINKYEERFGSNFANDKRLLKQHSITNKMLKRMLQNLDMKATIIIEDAGPDVPNPIGKPIRVDILGSGDDENESAGG